MIAGSWKSDKHVNNAGIDKVHLKCDSIQDSIVNCIRELILYFCAPISPTGQKIYKKPIVKLFKKINKSVLSHLTFYLEDDDHKPVDFSREVISFICQLIEIK